jgi:hypothetical protein
MVDACTIERGGGDPDPITGAPARTEVYDGACQVQTWEAQESRPEAGEFRYTQQRYTVKVPVGSYRPEVGDLVTITKTLLDPYLVGREFRVVALLHKSLATAYRLAVSTDV